MLLIKGAIKAKVKQYKALEKPAWIAPGGKVQSDKTQSMNESANIPVIIAVSCEQDLISPNFICQLLINNVETERYETSKSCRKHLN